MCWKKQRSEPKWHKLGLFASEKLSMQEIEVKCPLKAKQTFRHGYFSSFDSLCLNQHIDI